MNARFKPSTAACCRAAGQHTPGDAADSATPAGRACCCAAKAVVQVTMPSTPDRPHRTVLLLCGHHYRVSRQALEAARATVREIPGTPGDIATWIGVAPSVPSASVAPSAPSARSAAPAGR